jgi:cytochrome c553
MGCVLAYTSVRAQDVSPEVRKQANQLARTTCSACHGPNGVSISPTFPNLAAQTAPYLEQQLIAFRDQTRADPDAQAYMWGMASQLSNETIKGLAQLFSGQLPSQGHATDPKLMARGQLIFQQGVPEKAIPACATCHGERAQGNGPIPRLAGQHAGYLLKQMLVIQSVLRLAPVMHGVIQNLPRDQMEAIADYLESIGPTAH